MWFELLWNRRYVYSKYVIISFLPCGVASATSFEFKHPIFILVSQARFLFKSIIDKTKTKSVSNYLSSTRLKFFSFGLVVPELFSLFGNSFFQTNALLSWASELVSLHVILKYRKQVFFILHTTTIHVACWVK